MQHAQIESRRSTFKPLLKSDAVQAAVMVLAPGEKSSGRVENEHPLAEQWLYVVSGSGLAKAGTTELEIGPGSLLLIERREPHQVIATGKEPLVTLNFYAPPAYTSKGDVREAVQS